jgi:hypothetical protein
MITGHVPAVRLPPDHSGRRMAATFLTADLLDGTQAHVPVVIEHATRRIRILGVTLHPTGNGPPGKLAT